MPMISYVCPENHVEEHFYHRQSDAPSTVPCAACDNGVESTLSNSFEHTLLRPSRDALRFSPVVVDRRKDEKTGEYVYSYPGQDTDPITPGYERISLASIAAVDKFCKARSQEEKELSQLNAGLEKAHFDNQRRERRQQRMESFRRQFGREHSKMFDLYTAYRDKVREAKYDARMRRDPNFHNQAFSFDSSNRQSHNDVSTGWKPRK